MVHESEHPGDSSQPRDACQHLRLRQAWPAHADVEFGGAEGVAVPLAFVAASSASSTGYGWAGDEMPRQPQRIETGILCRAHLFFQVAQVLRQVLMRFVCQGGEQADFQDDAGGRSTMNSLPP